MKQWYNQCMATMQCGDTQVDFTKLVPLIQVSPGATISPASGVQTNFANGPLTYTVTALDGSIKAYTVNVRYSNTLLKIRDDTLDTPCKWLTSKRRLDITGTLNVPISIDMSGTYYDVENDGLTYYSYGPLPFGIGDEGNIHTLLIHLYLLKGKDSHVKLINNIFEYTLTTSGTETYLLFALDGKQKQVSYILKLMH